MSEFQKMMDELQKHYLISLDQKISDVQSAYAALDCAPIRDIFHKLKGTGATYGVPEISQLGEVMERICQLAPSHLTQFIPSALTLLRSIQETRKTGRSFEISTHPDFHVLAKFLSAAAP